MIQRIQNFLRQWFVVGILLVIVGLVGLTLVQAAMPAASSAENSVNPSDLPIEEADIAPLPDILVATSTPDLLVMPTPLPPTAEPTIKIHEVVAGDVLYNLGLQYGVDVNEIIAANPNMDPDRLEIGQQIRIPTTP